MTAMHHKDERTAYMQFKALWGKMLAKSASFAPLQSEVYSSLLASINHLGDQRCNRELASQKRTPYPESLPGPSAPRTGYAQAPHIQNLLNGCVELPLQAPIRTAKQRCPLGAAPHEEHRFQTQRRAAKSLSRVTITFRDNVFRSPLVVESGNVGSRTRSLLSNGKPKMLKSKTLLASSEAPKIGKRAQPGQDVEGSIGESGITGSKTLSELSNGKPKMLHRGILLMSDTAAKIGDTGTAKLRPYGKPRRSGTVDTPSFLGPIITKDPFAGMRRSTATISLSASPLSHPVLLLKAPRTLYDLALSVHRSPTLLRR
ncbi:MAG: hypothetical protein Q9207_002915 [Kuettlingeria erythrocarpa]